MNEKAFSFFLKDTYNIIFSYHCSLFYFVIIFVPRSKLEKKKKELLFLQFFRHKYIGKIRFQ